MSGKETDKDKKPPTQKEILAKESLENSDLFHNSEEEVFAKITVEDQYGGHPEIWPIRSSLTDSGTCPLKSAAFVPSSAE